MGDPGAQGASGRSRVEAAGVGGGAGARKVAVVGGAAEDDKSMCTDQDALVHSRLKDVAEAADRLWGSKAFTVALEQVFDMKEHSFGTRDRPASPLKWDRKAWSHLCFFVAVGVGLDPGNWVGL